MTKQVTKLKVREEKRTQRKQRSVEVGGGIIDDVKKLAQNLNIRDELLGLLPDGMLKLNDKQWKRKLQAFTDPQKAKIRKLL